MLAYLVLQSALTQPLDPVVPQFIRPYLLHKATDFVTWKPNLKPPQHPSNYHRKIETSFNKSLQTATRQLEAAFIEAMGKSAYVAFSPINALARSPNVSRETVPATPCSHTLSPL